MLRIVADGSADMPEGWEEKFGINILPLNIQLGEETFLQGRDITSSNFYDLVLAKKLPPKTSLPSPSQVIEFYKSIVKKGDQILSIHVGSKLSGTYNVVQKAAGELVGEIEVFPLDSGAGSAAIGFMCREARILDHLGWPASSIVSHLSSLREKLTVIFTVENLEFVRLSGRINSLQSGLASLLKINPIIVLKDGLLNMAQKVRTRQHAIDTIIENVRSRVGDNKIHLAIVHAACPETAKSLVEKVRKLIPTADEIVVTELSIPVAAHLGPGTIGIVAYPVIEGVP
ncbi:MAG: DegV family protein [Bellilinea sp.]